MIKLALDPKSVMELLRCFLRSLSWAFSSSILFFFCSSTWQVQMITWWLNTQLGDSRWKRFSLVVKSVWKVSTIWPLQVRTVSFWLPTRIPQFHSTTHRWLLLSGTLAASNLHSSALFKLFLWMEVGTGCACFNGWEWPEIFSLRDPKSFQSFAAVVFFAT